MSKMKQAYLAAIMASAMMQSQGVTREDLEGTPLTSEEIKKREEEINFKRGLKKFTYGDNVLYALNQRVADKKAVKKGWKNE